MSIGSNKQWFQLVTSGVALSATVTVGAQTPPTAPVVEKPVTNAAGPVVPGQAATPEEAAPATPVPVATELPTTSAPAPETAAERPAAPPPEPELATDAPLDAVKEKLRIGGGAILWYYHPTEDGQKNNLEFYNVRLTFDATFGRGFGFHVEPRFRDTKLRSYYAGPAWIQEGYGSYTTGAHSVKLGKVYSLLGLFWDNSFWGNVQVYDGLKLAPDYGASVDGKFALTPSFGVGYAAQFFVVDGATNVSLPGRDTLSLPDSRRRNEVVARVDPYVALGELGEARLGLSGSRFEADSPAIDDDDNDVLRYAADFKITYAGFGVWGEYLHQKGQSVTDYPLAGTPADDENPAVPGRASKNIDYYQVGAEYTYRRLTARYNFSAATYDGVDVKEWLHVPALGLKVNDNLSLGAEYVHWSRSVAGTHEKYNRSFNVLLYVNF
jgi:hypothetical protein